MGNYQGQQTEMLGAFCTVDQMSEDTGLTTALHRLVLRASILLIFLAI